MFHQAYIPTGGYVLSGIYTDTGICSIRHMYRQGDMFYQAYIPTRGYVPSGICTDTGICSVRHIIIPTQGYVPSGTYYRHRDMFHQAHITDTGICSIRHILPTQGYALSGIYDRHRDMLHQAHDIHTREFTSWSLPPSFSFVAPTHNLSYFLLVIFPKHQTVVLLNPSRVQTPQLPPPFERRCGSPGM